MEASLEHTFGKSVYAGFKLVIHEYEFQLVKVGFCLAKLLSSQV